MTERLKYASEFAKWAAILVLAGLHFYESSGRSADSAAQWGWIRALNEHGSVQPLPQMTPGEYPGYFCGVYPQKCTLTITPDLNAIDRQEHP